MSSELLQLESNIESLFVKYRCHIIGDNSFREPINRRQWTLSVKNFSSLYKLRFYDKLLIDLIHQSGFEVTSQDWQYWGSHKYTSKYINYTCPRTNLKLSLKFIPACMLNDDVNGLKSKISNFVIEVSE
jgi:hypothetical protein